MKPKRVNVWKIALSAFGVSYRRHEELQIGSVRTRCCVLRQRWGVYMRREKYRVIGTEERSRLRDLQDPIIDNEGTRIYQGDVTLVVRGPLPVK